MNSTLSSFGGSICALGGITSSLAKKHPELSVLPKNNYDEVFAALLPDSPESDGHCRGALISPRNNEAFNRHCSRVGVGQVMNAELAETFAYWITYVPPPSSRLTRLPRFQVTRVVLSAQRDAGRRDDR